MKRVMFYLALAIVVPAVGFGAGAFGVRFMQWLQAPPAWREGDFSEIVAAVGSPVILLSTTTCPWCEKTRQWLREKGVNYRDCVADRDPFANGLLDDLGIRTVPQLLNANQAATGYREDLFDRVVADAPQLDASPTEVRCEPAGPIGPASGS